MSDIYEMAQRGLKDPSTINFAELRQDYVASEAYRPLKHILQTKLKQITDAATSFEEVAETCRNILLTNPLDLEARMLIGSALEKCGEAQASEEHNRFAEHLLDAILATGDGKSFQSAFHLVAEAEAWTVMRTFGIRATSQERIRQDGRVYDVFDGKLDERDVKIYFDVTDTVQILDATLGDEA